MSKEARNQKETQNRNSTGVGSDAQGILCQQKRRTMDIMSTSPSEVDKEAAINTLKQYYFKPRKEKVTYQKLAKEIGNIKPMTVYRIIMGITKNPHPQTIYQIYHFLDKVRWIKIYEHERKHGSWINYVVKKVKGWKGIRNFKFK